MKIMAQKLKYVEKKHTNTQTHKQTTTFSTFKFLFHFVNRFSNKQNQSINLF